MRCVDVSSQPPNIFNEGISLILFEWSALQLAIRNEWGGIDCRRKSKQLCADLLSWFAHSKVPLRIEDLESILHESLVFSFNTDVEDGSIEEVAEALMILYEECLQGNYESIEKLRKSRYGPRTASQTPQVGTKDDDKHLTKETLVMVVDEPKPRLESKPNDYMSMNKPKPRGTVRNEEDIWSFVANHAARLEFESMKLHFPH